MNNTTIQTYPVTCKVTQEVLDDLSLISERLGVTPGIAASMLIGVALRNQPTPEMLLGKLAQRPSGIMVQSSIAGRTGQLAAGTAQFTSNPTAHQPLPATPLPTPPPPRRGPGRPSMPVDIPENRWWIAEPVVKVRDGHPAREEFPFARYIDHMGNLYDSDFDYICPVSTSDDVNQDQLGKGVEVAGRILDVLNGMEFRWAPEVKAKKEYLACGSEPFYPDEPDPLDGDLR